jgi:hypothetical protein
MFRPGYGTNSERTPYGDDASQFFELWHPEQGVAGFAVFIHGGFWRAKYDLMRSVETEIVSEAGVHSKLV